MIITLLAVTFVIALAVSLLIAALFRAPVRAIMRRIVADELGEAWVRYLTLAIVVIGVSGGVQVWMLLVFFVFALIAFVLVRNAERKAGAG